MSATPLLRTSPQKIVLLLNVLIRSQIVIIQQKLSIHGQAANKKKYFLMQKTRKAFCPSMSVRLSASWFPSITETDENQVWKDGTLEVGSLFHSKTPHRSLTKHQRLHRPSAHVDWLSTSDFFSVTSF